MGRMTSTRIHFQVDQKVRKGQDFLWITIWTENVPREGREDPDDIYELRTALVENSQNCNEKDTHIANCIKAILAAYPNKLIIREIYLADNKNARLFFRIEIPF